jgi:hypothetical protein
MVCETVLPSIGVGILLFFSEILPFVSSVEANGVIDFAVKVLLKYKEKKEGRDLEENLNQSN